MSIRAVALWAIMVCLVGTGCEAESGGQASGDALEASEAEDAVSLTLSFPSKVREYENIAVTVEAIDSQGNRVEGFAGEVMLTVSGGHFSESTIALNQGQGVVEGFFNRAGRIVLEVDSAELSDQADLLVAPPEWTRTPEQGWVLSGVVDELDHWAYGGFWGGSIVAESQESWIGFFQTSEAGGGHAKHVNGLARLISEDEGKTWALEPEEPIREESGSASVFQEADGTLGMWRQDADNERVLIREHSTDLGLTWNTSGCEIDLGNSTWNAGGIRSLSALRDDADQEWIWFTGLDGAGENARGVIGVVRGDCDTGWSKPAIEIEAGDVGSWNEWEVFSPHVWREKGVWKLLAAGRVSSSSSSVIGYWTSSDGKDWAEAEENPQLGKLSGGWDSRGIFSPFVALDENRVPTVFFSGLPQDLRPRVVRARP